MEQRVVLRHKSGRFPGLYQIVGTFTSTDEQAPAELPTVVIRIGGERLANGEQRQIRRRYVLYSEVPIVEAKA